MTIRSYDWVSHHAHNRPREIAMVDVATDRRHTWAELDDRTARCASLLAGDFGVGYRDRVAVLAHNSTSFFEVQFACARLGAVCVPLNWRLTVPELEYICGDCAPAVLVHDSDLAETATKVAETSGSIARICWDGDADHGAASYEEALAAAARHETPYPVTHDDLLTIMYTSGTTGRPKGAMITHGMTFWNCVNQVEFFAHRTGMVNLAFLPLFHTGGLNCYANPAIHYGGTNVVMRDFDPSLALQLLGDPDVGITHFLGVPANFLMMSQAPEFADATFPTLECAGVGGSPTPNAIIETWLEKGLSLQQGFGMTETSPLVLALTARDAIAKIGAAGLPALHTEVRVVDDEGNDVEPGQTGELWVRGPNVTPGYWNRPDATEASFTDGWLHTGDATRQDEDGYFYIVDRWKDMYISGGENVYPAEVENIIYQLGGIAEAAVIGVPDDRWVEAGKAFIVLKQGTELTAADVINHCRQQLARFKVPQTVEFIDEIPHNATGKVLKRELRELASSASGS